MAFPFFEIANLIIY